MPETPHVKLDIHPAQASTEPTSFPTRLDTVIAAHTEAHGAAPSPFDTPTPAELDVLLGMVSGRLEFFLLEPEWTLFGRTASYLSGPYALSLALTLQAHDWLAPATGITAAGKAAAERAVRRPHVAHLYDSTNPHPKDGP